MNGCPLIRISAFIALCLCFAGDGQLLAQSGIYHSPEPPLADPDNPIQLVGAQFPAPNNSSAQSLGVPNVVVNVIAPAHVAYNEPLTYKLKVENTSTQPALEVRVLHPLNGAKFDKADPPPKQPQSETELEWVIGTLKGGESREMKVTVIPKADLKEFEAIAKVRFDHGRKATIKITRPEVAMKLSIPKDIQQFDVVPARLELRNPGPTEVKDIQITVALPDGVAHQYDSAVPGQSADPKNVPRLRTWTVPRLGPNELRSLDFRIVGSQPGPMNLESLAVPSNAARTNITTEVTVQPPRLELTATGPSQRAAHQPAVYRVAVKNAGQYPMRNITVTDKLPPQSDFVSATEGGQVFDSQVQWILPVVNPGETRVLELTTRHNRNETVKHQFAATFRGAKQQSEVTTSFESNAVLRVDFRGSPEAIDVNGTVRYVLTIDNNGSAPATNVRPIVSLPDSLTVIATDPQTNQRDGGRVIFDTTSVTAGGRSVFTVTARATRPSSAAVVTAELTANELEAGALRRQETTAIISGNRP